MAVDDLNGRWADAIEATMVSVEDGEIVSGIVVRVDSDEVWLDVGYKSEGVIPSRELSIRNDVDPSEVVSLGQHVEALVLAKEDKDGRLILSKKRAQYERAWGDIERIKEEDGVVSGPVIDVVTGGLILDIGLRGSLPASLIELRRVRDLRPYVGKTLQAKIIELDRSRNSVVLSRRAWLEEAQRAQRRDPLARIWPGEVRRGVVSSVVDFGAFVDLGGVHGLIHKSELSWKPVHHPGWVVQVGDPVEVHVLDVDLDLNQISLSLKATQPDPWQEWAGSHRVGELVYGRVTKLLPFGAFVMVGDGIEGLLHISELSDYHIDLPEQVVTLGEELWVRIMDVDLEHRRVGLSLTAIDDPGMRHPRSQQPTSLPAHTTPPTTGSAGPPHAAVDKEQLLQLVHDWERVRRRAPGRDWDEVLARKTGLDQRDVAFAKRIRDKIAHAKPVTRREFNRARSVTSTALQRLEPSGAARSADLP